MNALSDRRPTASIPASVTAYPPGTPPSSARSYLDLKLWTAHYRPEKPLDLGVFICGCVACGLAVRAAAQADPTFLLVVRGYVTRRVVTVAQAADAVTSPEGLAALLEPGDDLRDLCGSVLNPEATVERRTTAALRSALERLERGAPEVAGDQPGVEL